MVNNSTNTNKMNNHLSPKRKPQHIAWEIQILAWKFSKQDHNPVNKGNNKINELWTILQRESQNS
jgi:hypothetical protein